MSRILQDREALVRNASATATELIRGAIVEGRLVPGERLKEEELARELGISRTPIREALQQLTCEGLLDGRRNAGVKVARRPPDSIRELVVLPSPSRCRNYCRTKGFFTSAIRPGFLTGTKVQIRSSVTASSWQAC